MTMKPARSKGGRTYCVRASASSGDLFRELDDAGSETAISNLIGESCERARRPVPLQVWYARHTAGRGRDEGRVSAQRGQSLEQQRQVATILIENLERKFFDRAKTIEQRSRRLGAQTFDPRITVSSIADQSEIIRNQFR